MAERIGLEAVMDMAGFTKGMKEYTGGIDQMTDKTEKGSSIFSKLGGALGTVAKVGIGAAVAGFGALTAIIADSVGEAAAAQEAEAQLDAVLRSTGAAAAEQGKQWEAAQGKVVTSTRLSAGAIADLTAKLEVQKLKHVALGASIQEQQQKVSELTKKYGEQGLATIQAKAKLEEMKIKYDEQGKSIDTLTDKIAKGGEKITVSLADKLGLVPPVVQMTKDEILNLADALSKVTPFEDDLIVSTEAVLLQFKSLGKDVFPQATELALDLAQRLGIDAVSAAKMLGKALVEPGEGLARLKQAGVTFSDEQEKMIEKMVAAGDVAGAQKLIMDELEKSIGGAARAAGETFTGKMEILKNTIGNVKETIGAAFLPVLTELASKFATFVQENAPAIEAFFQGLADWIMNRVIPALVEIWNWLATNLPPAIAALSEFWTGTLQPALQAIWEFIQTNVIPVLTEVYNWLATNLPVAIQTLSDYWTTTLQPALQELWSFIQDNLNPIFAAVAAVILAVVVPAFVAWAGAAVAAAISTITALAPVLIPIAAIAAAVGLLAAAWENDWGGIRTTLTKVWTEKLEPIFNQLKAWLQENIPKALQILSDFWTNTLKPALQAVWEFIDTKVIPVFKAVWDFIQTNLLPLFQKFVELGIVIMKKELEILTAIWENVLKPALEKVWAFIQDNLLPIFQAIIDKVRGPLGDALNGMEGILGKVAGWFSGIGDAIKGVIGWVQSLIDKIKNIQIPVWLQGHSPPPLAKWFDAISGAVKELAKAQLPKLQAQLNMGLGEMTWPRQSMMPAYATSQNVNVSFGDTTINSGLDAELFQAQVLQTVTRAVRGY